ncbi:unnamed protein product, partial [Mesorhabditis belari]|uniref:Histone deacetylase interacting domain-containing protein n=1 Tax=Mesorhabditis belari TaxID=2138241 RepID=A0AAF3ET05_9BILA
MSTGLPPGGLLGFDDPQQNANQSKVKVEDALSYLDQVKNQFTHESSVYTQFLDIMKDFKNQTIDTPGVIQRVSQLFSGKPALIMGFNAFLPSGFQVLMNEGNNKILIREPNGNVTEVCDYLSGNPHLNTPRTVSQMPIIPPTQGPIEMKPSILPDSFVHQEPTVHQFITNPALYRNAAANRIQPAEITVRQQITMQMAASNAQQQQQQQQMTQVSISHPQPLTVAERKAPPQPQQIIQPVQTVTPIQQSTRGEKKEKTEELGNPGFSQALGYVNKIKSRFHSKPSVYKQFLDILTKYQDQMKIATNSAAAERYILDAIGKLFEDEPDLLDEFRYFLPEATLMAKGRIEEPSSEDELEDEIEEPETIDQPSSSEEESEDEREDDIKAESEERNTPEDRSQSLRGKRQLSVSHYGPGKKPRLSRKQLWTREVPMDEVDDLLTNEDIEVFEKIRRVLPTKRYKNFLRGLNLYTSKLVNEEEVLQFIKAIIGDLLPEVVNYFHVKLGVSIERIEDEARRPGISPRIHSDLAHEIDYNSCKQLGASYRALPDTYRRPVCSGRNQLCREVLNDTWVSFPSWLSEDSTNVSQKKSVYEEYLHKTEDDRFELDIIIEVNKYAITAMETIMRKIKQKKDVFVDDCLGSTSSSIMQRAIKRIYGEASFKIIEAMKKNPTVAVPRVIERLKQKQSEWIDAQRKMNGIWRDHMEKYFQRAMDHQSNLAKTVDAKWMRGKALIYQIEKLFDERQRRSVLGEVADEGPHLVITYPVDMTIIHDVNDLLLHHVKRFFQKEEKEKMKEVIRRWIPEWFGVEREPDSDDEETPSNSKQEEEGRRRTRQMERTKSPVPVDIDKIKEKTMDLWNRPKLTTTYRMVYGANPLFVFFRFHGMVCERLGKLKKKCDEMVDEFMIEEEIQKKREEVYKKYGKDVLGHEINASDPFNGLSAFKAPRVNPEKHYALALLEVKNLMDGATEQTAFEDNVRTLFPSELHQVVMMDKFIIQMCKQLHQLVTEEESFRSLDAYDKYRMNKAPKMYEFDENRTRIETAYSDFAERQLIRENCFKIYTIHDVDEPRVTIELVDTEKDLEEFDAEREKRNAEVRRRFEVRRRGRGSTGETNGDNEHGSPGRSKQCPDAGPAFLKRNVSKVSSGPESPTKFYHDVWDTVRLSPYSPSVCPNFRAQMQRSRRSSKEKIEVLREMVSKRHRKAGKMLEQNATENDEEPTREWLNQGVKRIAVYNPDYEFLTFNRYLSKLPPNS